MSDITSTSQRMAAFDDSDSANDAIDLIFIEHYISGSHPSARSAFLGRVRDDADPAASGAAPLRVAVTDGARSVMASGPGWILVATRWPNARARVSVVAQTRELANEVFDQVTAGVRVPPTVDPSKVDVGFWYLAGHGPERSERSLAIAPWSSIRANYTSSAAAAFDGADGDARRHLAGQAAAPARAPGHGEDDGIACPRRRLATRGAASTTCSTPNVSSTCRAT